ncbi:hypothetical protein ACLB2K_037779 [Fragaria x ananassa]
MTSFLVRKSCTEPGVDVVIVVRFRQRCRHDIVEHIYSIVKKLKAVAHTTIAEVNKTIGIILSVGNGEIIGESSSVLNFRNSGMDRLEKGDF